MASKSSGSWSENWAESFSTSTSQRCFNSASLDMFLCCSVIFYKGTNLKFFETFQNLESHLHTVTISNTSILIKGSRGMALERVLVII